MAQRSIVVRLQAEISGYRQAMDQAAQATRRVGEEGTRASSAIGRMAQSAQNNRASWETAGRTMTMFGALAVGGLGIAIKAAVDWETAWTGVLKTVDGTPAQLQALEDGLRQMAREIPATHEEIAAVAEAAGQLGVKTPDILGFTRVMVDLGNATNLSAEEAATSLAQLMNIMQTAPGDVDNLGATIVDLGNNSATTERDIVQMAQGIAGAGAIIGASEADILSIAAAIASVGIPVEAGGTAVSRVMTDIAKSVAQGGKDLEGFANVAGLSSEQFVTAFQDDPAMAFVSFTEGLGRIDDAGGDVFTTMSNLGQSDVRVSKALLGMANSGDLLRRSLELGNDAWEANTALTEEAEKRYATTASRIESAQGSIADAAISMGETFLPIIANIANGISKMADSFGALPGPIQATIGVTTALVGGTALLAGGFLLLLPRIIETRVAFGVLTAGMTRTNRALRFLNGAMQGVLLWGAAFVAAAGGFGLLVDKVLLSGQVTPELDKVKDAIRGVAESGDDIGHLAGQFRNFGDVGGLAVNSAKSLTDAFDQLLKPSTTDRVSGFFDGLPGVTGYMERLEERVGGVDDALSQMLADGEVEEVREFQAALLESGYSAEEINKLLPKTIEAMTAAGEAGVEGAAGAEAMAGGMAATEAASEAAAEALEKWRKEVVDASLSFIDPKGAYDKVIQANVDFAQSTADATDSAEDSWEDFYDGQEVDMAQYIAALQEQVDAQVAYNSNLLSLKTKVSAEYFSFLEGLGVEGAPLVQSLSDATVEELNRVDDLYVMGAQNSQGFADGLESIDAQLQVDAADAQRTVRDFLPEWTRTADAIGADPALIDADATDGEAVLFDFAAASEEMARTRPPWLIDANTTPGQQKTTSLVGQINAKGNGLPDWAVDANTNPALGSADSAVRTINGKTASVTVTADTSSAYAKANGFWQSFSSRVLSIPVTAQTAGAHKPGAFATGGAIVGPGTGTSDSVPILASNGEHMLTAAEVAAAGGHAEIFKLRAALRERRKYATGGPIYADRAPVRGVPAGVNPQPAYQSGPNVTVQAPSLDGAVVTGRFEVGQDGLLTLIDGRLMATSKARTAGIRGGSR